MERPDVLELGSGRDALSICVEHAADLAVAVGMLGLETDVPVLVAIGGASGIDEAGLVTLAPGADALVRAAAAAGATIVDGGTDVGVMALLGRAHTAAGSRTPLVGVVAESLACRPGEEVAGGAAPLEPNHTHFVLVPGSSWGDEAPWLARLAGLIAGRCPSVTVLVDGGEISLTDVEESIAAGRPVLVAAGTGRLADELAAGLSGGPTGDRVAELAGSTLVEAVSLREDAWPSLEERVAAILASRVPIDGS